MTKEDAAKLFAAMTPSQQLFYRTLATQCARQVQADTKRPEPLRTKAG